MQVCVWAQKRVWRRFSPEIWVVLLSRVPFGLLGSFLQGCRTILGSYIGTLLSRTTHLLLSAPRSLPTVSIVVPVPGVTL